MPGWNFADVWEVIAEQIPDAQARCTATAASPGPTSTAGPTAWPRPCSTRGAVEQDKVAQYLYNGPEYIESMFAAFKAGLVPINTNYRYQDDELVYLWDNADCVAVVFHGAFTDTIERIRDRVPASPPGCGSTTATGCAPSGPSPTRRPPPATTTAGRSRRGAARRPPDDDLHRRHHRHAQGRHVAPGRPVPQPRDPAEPRLQDAEADPAMVRDQVKAPGPVGMPACPLMHGTGLYTQLIILSLGRQQRHADLPPARHRGDVRHHRARAGQPDRHRGRRLRQAHAAGARREPGPLGPGQPVPGGVVGRDVERAGQAGPARAPAQPDPGRRLLVVRGAGHGPVGVVGRAAPATPPSSSWARTRSSITDDGRRVEPGSGEIGRVAVGGFQPVGYYKDPEKTAATFIEFEGKRYSCPGDYAMVEADGSLTLLGRGSVVINTGGEKVFPEEVEEVLKTHPGVRDAVAVGVPDDKFGEAVAAVVEPAPAEDVDARRADRPRAGQAGRLQGAQARVRGRHHRPGPQRQGRLQAAQGLRHRRRSTPGG